MKNGAKMKHFRKRILSAVLGAVLVFSNAQPVFATDGDDDSIRKEDHDHSDGHAVSNKEIII